jgi:hypothetical protein
MPEQNLKQFRWIAVVTHRAEAGPVEINYHIEELEELHDKIERGPSWETIESIVVRLNPRRAIYPGDTLEKAARR